MIKTAWRFAALRNGFQDAVAYRLEFLFEILGAAFVPAAIQWVLWYALFRIGGAERVAGMTYGDMVQYTLTSMLFTQIRGGDNDFELAEMVRSGQLSNYLLRPVGVVEFVYIRGVAPKLMLAGGCLALGCTVGLFFGLSPLRMAAGMGLALAGNVIHYQLGAALATSAFLLEESYAVLMVKNLIVSLLSGELIPLNLFPAQLQWIWKSTPFYLYVFGPTQVASGRWSYSMFAGHLALACVWMLFGWMLIRVTWGAGIKRYSSIGG